MDINLIREPKVFTTHVGEILSKNNNQMQIQLGEVAVKMDNGILKAYVREKH